MPMGSPKWHKEKSIQTRGLLVRHVRWHQEANSCTKAEAKQGQWITCGNLDDQKLTWSEENRLSFIITASYDVLPTPKSLDQWI